MTPAPPRPPRPGAVKAAYDLAAGKQSPATSLAGYGIADAYTKDEVDAKMSSALEYKGSKDTYADLPTTGNKKGDVWNIVNADAAHGVNAGDNVAWNGHHMGCAGRYDGLVRLHACGGPCGHFQHRAG